MNLSIHFLSSLLPITVGFHFLFLEVFFQRSGLLALLTECRAYVCIHEESMRVQLKIDDYPSVYSFLTSAVNNVCPRHALAV